jgi:hypothetical protein
VTDNTIVPTETEVVPVPWSLGRLQSRLCRSNVALRTRIPRPIGLAARDVVAVTSGQNNGRHRGKVEQAGKIAEGVDDAAESPAIPTGQIELVHSQHEIPHANEMGDHCVARRLSQKSPPRVQENDRKVGVRRSASSVASIASVPNRVLMRRVRRQRPRPSHAEASGSRSTCRIDRAAHKEPQQATLRDRQWR